MYMSSFIICYIIIASEASESGFPIGIIIGVLVAVALAVVVIIILICICYRYVIALYRNVYVHV